jgi:cell division septal protein FtsQ
MYASTTKIFNVKRIEITGCAHVTNEEVRSLLDLEEGENIFSWDMGIAKKRIAAHPWVKSVRISRNFIPASVKTKIEEYVPVACLRIGDRGYLVSKDGKIFVSTAEPFNGLTIKGDERVAFGSEGGRQLLADGLAVVNAVKDKGVMVKDVSLGVGGRIEVGLANDVGIMFWGMNDLSKLDRAFAIMKELPVKEGILIDLSFEDRVVIRSLDREETGGYGSKG